MKKIYFLLLMCLTISVLGYGQFTEDIILKYQSFEGNDTWNYSFNPITVPSNVTWANVEDLGALLPSEGDYFRGISNPTNNPNASIYSLTFDTVDISDYNGIEITFDYFYETTEDLPLIYYILTIDGGTPTYVYLPTTASNGQVLTIDPITVPDEAEDVSIEIYVQYTYFPGQANDADTANIGIDNVLLYTTEAFTGLTYLSDTDGWLDGVSPNSTTENTDALIVSGTYNISDDVALKSILLYQDAAINIEATGALYVVEEMSTYNQITIQSDSDQFGSLMVDGTVTGTATYNRHVNGQGLVSYGDLISAPVTGETFGVFAAANDTNLPYVTSTHIKFFGPWDRTIGSYETWTTIGNDLEILEPGIGYATATTDNGTFTFTGTVNTESVSVDVFHKADVGYSQWNLIGNPYPSYISIYDFIEYNKYDANGADIFYPGKTGIWTYDGAYEDFWVIYNQANTMGDTTIMAPGQGFYIAVDDNLAGVMTFNPDMRIKFGSGDDFVPGRADNYNKSHFKLSLSADKLYHINEVYFFDDIVSLGLDEGFDTAHRGNNESGFTLFTQLVETNPTYKMAIQSLPNSALEEGDVTIALGVIAPKGEQITLDLMETTLPDNVELYLEDTENENAAWTLLTEEAYTFTTTKALTGLGRFYIHTAEAVSSVSPVEDNTIESLQFFTGNQSIKIKGTLDENTKLTVYDIQGRQMNTTILNTTVSEYTMNTNGYSSGIYIVRVEDQKGNQTTKRVILK